MAFGITDIAMNAQGSVVEQSYRRPVLNGMHAGWCVGAISGGLLGSLGATAGMSFGLTRNDIATADGAKGGRRIANGPLANGLAGALIGRIGPNGAPFGIGTMGSISAPASGVLYLGINDDGFGDNKGQLPGRRQVGRDVGTLRCALRAKAGRPPGRPAFFAVQLHDIAWPTGRTRSTCPARGSR